MVHLYSEHDFKQAMVTARGFEWSKAQQSGYPTQARPRYQLLSSWSLLAARRAGMMFTMRAVCCSEAAAEGGHARWLRHCELIPA